MIAIDTNVAIRIITADDPYQNKLALAVVQRSAFVSSGVWMEIEWVLRSFYRWSRAEIAGALRSFLLMSCVTAANAEAVHWAIDRYGEGADWADMIHLIDAAGRDAFVTFDRDLKSKAGSLTPVAIELLK